MLNYLHTAQCCGLSCQTISLAIKSIIKDFHPMPALSIALLSYASFLLSHFFPNSVRSLNFKVKKDTKPNPLGQWPKRIRISTIDIAKTLVEKLKRKKKGKFGTMYICVYK